MAIEHKMELRVHPENAPGKRIILTLNIQGNYPVDDVQRLIGELQAKVVAMDKLAGAL